MRRIKNNRHSGIRESDTPNQGEPTRNKLGATRNELVDLGMWLVNERASDDDHLYLNEVGHIVSPSDLSPWERATTSCCCRICKRSHPQHSSSPPLSTAVLTSSGEAETPTPSSAAVSLFSLSLHPTALPFGGRCGRTGVTVSPRTPPPAASARSSCCAVPSGPDAACGSGNKTGNGTGFPVSVVCPRSTSGLVGLLAVASVPVAGCSTPSSRRFSKSAPLTGSSGAGLTAPLLSSAEHRGSAAFPSAAADVPAPELGREGVRAAASRIDCEHESWCCSGERTLPGSSTGPARSPPRPPPATSPATGGSTWETASRGPESDGPNTVHVSGLAYRLTPSIFGKDLLTVLARVSAQVVTSTHRGYRRRRRWRCHCRWCWLWRCRCSCRCRIRRFGLIKRGRRLSIGIQARLRGRQCCCLGPHTHRWHHALATPALLTPLCVRRHRRRLRDRHRRTSRPTCGR